MTRTTTYLIILFSVFLFSWSAMGDELMNDTPKVELRDAQAVNTTINLSFGDITVTGGASNLMEGEFQYSIVEWKPIVSYQVKDTVGNLRVDFPVLGGFSLFNLGNKIRKSTILLNNSVPMNLFIKVGAGKSQFTLGSVALETLKIETGAGEVMIDLKGNTSLSRLDVQTGVGKTTVDLQGEWTKNIDARIISGMGEITVLLPQNIGVIVDTVKGLGVIDADNLIVNGNTYTNQYFGKTNSTLSIYLESGIGKINLY